MSASSPQAALLAEFIGTFMLVFTVGCNLLSKTSAVWAPTSIAFTLMVMIYAFASISGGHLNPAVTLAAVVTKRLPAMAGFSYFVAQLFAGMLAALCLNYLYEAPLPVIGPTSGFLWWQAAAVEIAYTAMLAFVVLNVTAKRNNPTDEPNQFYGLAIGFVIIAGGYGAGKISGSVFNPAISLGFNLLSVDAAVQGLAYTLYQVTGSLIAAFMVRLVRPEETYTVSELDGYSPWLLTRMICEFLGTFFLVLTVGLNVLGNSVATAWSAAAALTSMIYALGDVSGGHFNPAVTLAVVLSGKGTAAKDLLCYWIAQVAGGFCAALLYSEIYRGKTFAVASKAPYTDNAAYIVEFTFTLVLCYVVLSVACVKGISTPLSRNGYFALAIGSTVIAGGVACGNISGGYFNPAVTLGVGISSSMKDGSLSDAAMFRYCSSQISAGLVASLLFVITHSKEYASKPTEQRRLYAAQ
eukprot:TRINITY_DN287_c3_g1_i1.p1 TRINITY_DN287_c3_g1~~TRINITY_DN287_c3_g1_i1.p1  ORF type:complete len:487 (+),score=74.77 TRINITY_DN287_c3_g1_i1:63-1463(+)